MDKLDTGLIIADPYISQILSGEKTWEMRSQRTAKRQTIGLIKKGSGQVVGKATIVDCIGPLSFSELLERTDKHGISKEQVEAGLLNKWNFAWILEDIEMFDTQVPYQHPSGAVIWVDLTKALRKPKDSVNKAVSIKDNRTAVKSTVAKIQSPLSHTDTSFDKSNKLPVARDGTSFGTHLSKKGWYTVGNKGDEQKFSSFEQALKYLKSMDTAKWRRPNPKGNWGIVSAIEWK